MNPLYIGQLIYRHEIENYRRDSQRTLKAHYYRKHPLAKKMKEWMTLWTILGTVGTLFASHIRYA